jgi:Fur family ferric uptake transcriptional regulator
MQERTPPLAPGMRQTLPRRLVWEALSRLGPHCTAEEIASDLDDRQLQIPRSSVYRALEALTASGAVRVVHFGGGAARYELAGEEHRHAVCHAICQVCHGILHLEESLVQDLESHLRQDHRFAPAQTEVVVVGVCAQCARTGHRGKPERRTLEHIHYGPTP